MLLPDSTLREPQGTRITIVVRPLDSQRDFPRSLRSTLKLYQENTIEYLRYSKSARTGIINPALIKSAVRTLVLYLK